MSTPLESVRNIGPALAAELRAAGVPNAEELRALGADTAYSRLIETGVRPHFIAYYALVMGLQGRPWNDCHGSEKTALRQRFDALVVASRPVGKTLARALDELGIRLEVPGKPTAR